MAFLFPGTLFHKTTSYLPSTKLDQEMGEALLAEEAFNFEIQRYLGFGFLLSFIPGTKAYLARCIFGIHVNHYRSQYQQLLSSYDISPQEKAAHGDLYGLRGLWKIVDAFFKHIPFTDGFNYTTNQCCKDILHLKKEEIEAGAAVNVNNWLALLPIFNNGFYFTSGWKTKILHAILNPLMIVDRILYFTKQSCLLLLNLGTEKDTPSSYLRFILKSLISMIFWMPLTATSVVKEITDIPYQLVKHLIARPLYFVFASLFQSLSSQDQFLLPNISSHDCILEQLNESPQPSKKSEKPANTKSTTVIPCYSVSSFWIFRTSNKEEKNRLEEHIKEASRLSRVHSV